MPLVQTLCGGLVRVLRRRVVILALMIGASFLVTYALRAAGEPSACAYDPDGYFTTLPNGPTLAANVSCVTCHLSDPYQPPYDNSRGPFGTRYSANIGDQFVLPNGSLAYHWTQGLATTDSDGDGYTNGEELQDPTGGWVFGSANPGDSSRVTSPNNGALFPPQPLLNGLNGVGAGGSYSGPVDLSVTFDPAVGTYGARRVVYEVLDGAANVVKSYPPIDTLPGYGGYTDTPATFNFSWDTYDVPNGTYTIRATLYDALSAAHGGPRSNSISVDNVTIANQPRAIRYIATTGADAGDCTNSGAPCATIDYAASQAQNNDELRVAAGTYTPGSGAAALAIGTRVTLIGGYTSANWTTPDPAANPTILDGQGQRTVLRFDAAASGFTVRNVTIRNGSGADGGGIAIAGAQGTVRDVRFENNHASGSGGALAVDAAGGVSIRGATFLGNSAGASGGALYSLADFSLANALFANNTAPQGAAIATGQLNSATIAYATIAGSGPSDAIRLGAQTGAVELTNTLISGYATGVAVAAQANLTLQSVLVANDGANSVATPIDNTGGGTVSGAPIRALAGYTDVAGGDYHLAFGAPAADAGVAVAGVATDLDGRLRPFGAAPDIGAYEFSGPVGSLHFDVSDFGVTLPTNVASVVVDLSIRSVAPVTVQYTTQDGTAMAGVDYMPISGTLTIPAGQMDADVDIALLDSGAPGPRSFTLILSNPTIAHLDPLNISTITIYPPEVPPPPRVIITAAAPHASRNGAIPAVLTLTRDSRLDTPLTVNYTVSGNAVAGVDYQALPGSLTFQPGQSGASILIVPIGGSGYKLVTVTLTPSEDYLLGRSSATADIDGNAAIHAYLPLVVSDAR